MIINKENLLRALEIVKPGLSNKEIIEQTTSFAFKQDRVITYNDEISISHPIEGLDLTGAIQAENLYKFLAKVKREELEFEKEENQIVLISGRAKAGLAVQAEIRLPLDTEVAEKGDWHTLPKDFNKSVKFAIGACSADMTYPVLSCVHIRKDGIIEGSDSFRIINWDLKEEMPLPTFLLPATSAVEVVKLQPTRVAKGKGWIHFQNDNETVISCRVMSDSYPNTTKHLNIKGTRLILPETTSDVLDRASVFAKRDKLLEEIVIIKIEDRKLIIKADSDHGWFEEDINIRHKGDPIEFAITPYLLKNILSETGECVLNDGHTKLEFRGEGWQYLTMLRSKNKE